MSNSEQDRERLKEEYKEHYRKIRDAKEKLRRSQSVQNISDAMQKMNSDDLLESVDDFLGKVRSKVAGLEARLEVAMDNLSETDTDDFVSNPEYDEEVRKEKAKETLKQMRIEMGMLYSELEHKAGSIRVEKTVGPPEKQTENTEQVEKTVGSRTATDSGKVDNPEPESGENVTEKTVANSGNETGETESGEPNTGKSK